MCVCKTCLCKFCSAPNSTYSQHSAKNRYATSHKGKTGGQPVAQIRQQIARFIPEEEYDKTVQEFTKDIFSDFFMTLPMMTEDKKRALDEYLNKMSLAIDLSNLHTTRRNN